jgi:hypothetical protein
MAGRDIMKGRHSVGTQRVNTGKTRSGQSEPLSNKIKTNARAEYSKRKPFVPNAKDTSKASQIEIASAPSPFTDRMNTPQMPVGTGPRGAVPGQEPKNIYAGKSGSSIGQSNPSGSPVGYSKLPNQGFQIGGRTSVKSTPRKSGDNGSGYPAKKNARFYGER